MGIFDLFRSSGQTVASNNDEDAARLINDGNAIEREGRLDEAMQCYENAVKTAPMLGRAHLNCGNILLKRGDVGGALKAFDIAIACQPDYSGAHYNKGNVLFDLKDYDAAIACFRRSCELSPELAIAHNNLGLALKEQGQVEEALDCFRQALKITPDFIQAHFNLGNLLSDLGRLDPAIVSFRSLLQLQPDHAFAHHNMGSALLRLGKTKEGIASFQHALQILPGFAEAHFNLGNAQRILGHLDEAERSYRWALELRPDCAATHNNLGNVLESMNKRIPAIDCYRRALSIDPHLAIAHNSLGMALCYTHPEAAVASFRQALKIQPDYAEAHSNLLFNLVLCESASTDSLYEEHCRFGDQFEAPYRNNWAKHTNSRDPERYLKVGIVSADLRHHVVAQFVEPVLKHLSSYPTLRLYAYHNHTVEDHVTHRLRAFVKQWNNVSGLSDEALSAKIMLDGIDILIDLSIHSGGNRLPVFARKPAPIQVSWLAHPSTSGLRAIDYYLTDRYLTPPGMCDGSFTERLVYLPAVAPFQIAEELPPISTLPAQSAGFVTFGSFHKPSKLNRSVIALWASLLRALPNARLILGNMPDKDEFKHLIEWFQEEGIADDRLSFYPTVRRQVEYLKLHTQVDICLDVFPFSGYAITHLALLMGVPTITLAGKMAASRQGVVVLSQVGLESFIAEDPAQFIAIGLAWANDLAALASVREGLRERIGQSPGRQPSLIAAALTEALRGMWRRWCAVLPTESFAVESERQADQQQ